MHAQSTLAPAQVLIEGLHLRDSGRAAWTRALESGHTPRSRVQVSCWLVVGRKSVNIRILCTHPHPELVVSIGGMRSRHQSGHLAQGSWYKARLVAEAPP